MSPTAKEYVGEVEIEGILDETSSAYLLSIQSHEVWIDQCHIVGLQLHDGPQSIALTLGGLIAIADFLRATTRFTAGT